MIVHLLQHGFARCGLPGAPFEWPRGHQWDSILGLENVTCVSCLAVHGVTLPRGPRPRLGAGTRGAIYRLAAKRLRHPRTYDR